MPSSFRSARHKRLAEIISEERQRAGMHQSAVAKKLGRHQPFIANIESGQRRIDITEFLMLSQIIGFDPHEALQKIIDVEDLV